MINNLTQLFLITMTINTRQRGSNNQWKTCTLRKELEALIIARRVMLTFGKWNLGVHTSAFIIDWAHI